MLLRTLLLTTADRRPFDPGNAWRIMLLALLVVVVARFRHFRRPSRPISYSTASGWPDRTRRSPPAACRFRSSSRCYCSQSPRCSGTVPGSPTAPTDSSEVSGRSDAHRVVCHLDRLLVERGLTLTALAEQVGVTRQPVHSEERPRPGGPLLHTQRPVRGAGLPTRRSALGRGRARLPMSMRTTGPPW